MRLKYFYILFFSLFLFGCSSSNLGKEVEVKGGVKMAVTDIHYQNGWLYVDVEADGSNLSFTPTFFVGDFTVTDSDGDDLKYSQVDYTKNSYDMFKYNTDDVFSKLISVEGKGKFVLQYKTDKDKSGKYTVEYTDENDGKKTSFTWTD